MTIEFDIFQITSLVSLFLALFFSNIYFIFKYKKRGDDIEEINEIRKEDFVERYLALLIIDDFCKVVDDVATEIKDFSIDNKLPDLQVKAIALSRLCKKVQPKNSIVDFARSKSNTTRGSVIQSELDEIKKGLKSDDDNQ